MRYTNKGFIKLLILIILCYCIIAEKELPDLNGSQVLSVCVGGKDDVKEVEVVLEEFQTEVSEWARVFGKQSGILCSKGDESQEGHNGFKIVKNKMGRKHVRDRVEGKKVVVIDVEVSKKVLGRFKERLRQNGLRFYIKVTSLKRLIRENIRLNNEEALKRTVKLNGGGDEMRKGVLDVLLGRYPRWEELEEWLEAVQGLYPSLVSLETIGRTFEGRNIYVLKIKASSSPPSPLPVMWLDGGIHAREWVTVSSVVFIITQIVKVLTNSNYDDISNTKFDNNNHNNHNNNNHNNNNHNNNSHNIYNIYKNVKQKNFKTEQLRNHKKTNNNTHTHTTNNNSKYNDKAFLHTLVSSVEWHIAPVLNPDGYAFSHTSEKARLWRKNRSLRRSGYSTRYHMQCHGADLNRNFDFMWGKTGAAVDPCLESYRGEKAAYENETRSQTSHWLRHSARLKGWMTLHSYGQLVMNRWAYKLINNTQEYNRTLAVAKEVSEAIRLLSGQEYVPGSAPVVLYTFSGGGGDWVRHNVRQLTHVYDMELRDDGHYGFLLPPSLSLPAAREAWQAVKVVASHVVAEVRRAAFMAGGNSGAITTNYTTSPAIKTKMTSITATSTTIPTIKTTRTTTI